MTRRIMWQAILAVSGIALIFVVLFRLASTVEPEVQAEQVPVSGGTYIEGVVGYSETINPVLAPRMVPGNPADQDLSSLVFSGLVAIDESGQLIPALATGWEISDDGAIYEFSLRDDVTWHDGAPFTATDVAFTIQALQDPGYQGDTSLAELWRNVTVNIVDELTVRCTLEEAFPSFLYYASIGILPSHLLSNVPAVDLPLHDFSKQEPVGTGMFMVERITSDQVILVANQDYYGAQPYIQRLEFWFYPDWESLLEDYRREAIHGFQPGDSETLPELISMPNLNLYFAQTAGYGLVYLNLVRESVPFLQEKEVRQALLYALDRGKLVDQALAGRGFVADSPIPPILWAHDPTVKQYGYDPERAIGLLDATGWVDSDGDLIRDKEGQELSFSILVGDNPTMVRMAELVAAQWRGVGVNASVRSVSAEAAVRFVLTRNFDAALVEVDLTADPDPYPLWHSSQAESGQNFPGYASEDMDRVMEEARLVADAERRLELYRSFQAIFAEDVPSLLLYYPVLGYAVDARVGGVQLSPVLHPSDRFRNLQDWYVRSEESIVSENGTLDKTEE